MTARRDLLLRAAALPFAGIGMSVAAPLPGSTRENLIGDGPVALAAFASPEATADVLVRLMSSTGASPAWWRYTGDVMAILPKQPPLRLFRLEGGVATRATLQSSHRWLVHSVTFTVFRALDSSAILRSFENPLTGRRVDVQPNLLHGSAGEVVAPDGLRFARFADACSPAPLRVEPDVIGNDVRLTLIRCFPDILPQPVLEWTYLIVRAAELQRPERPTLPATFSETYVAPWSRFLDAGDLPGHQLWQSWGAKVTGLDAFPADYRREFDSQVPREALARL